MEGAPGTLALVAALAVAAATDGVPRAVALFVALAGAGPVYPFVLATAPGATDARVLAPLIAAGSLGGALVTGIGTMAYRSDGLPGVLLLAAGALAVCLLAGGSWRPQASR